MITIDQQKAMIAKKQDYIENMEKTSLGRVRIKITSLLCAHKELH